MQGYSPKLPLTYDKGDDGHYGLNKTILESIKQNLRMLLLTSPGERIMNPDFGVGLRRYLFSNDNARTREEIQGRIFSQVKKYLGFIQILEVNISPPNDENTLFMRIRYTIPALNVNDELNI